MMSGEECDHHLSRTSARDLPSAHAEQVQLNPGALHEGQPWEQAYTQFAGNHDPQGYARAACGEASDSHLSPVWQKQLPAARIVWNVISDDALREADGRTELLIELVRQHYALPYSEARRQVRRFFMTHKP